MSRDFDWSEAEREGAVVQPQAFAVAVYGSAKDHLVIIRQEGGPYDDDVWVELHRTHVPAVAMALLREIGLTATIHRPQAALPPPASQTDDAGQAPSAAAERAKRYRERKRQERDGVTKRRDANGAERDGVTLPFKLTG